MIIIFYVHKILYIYKFASFVKNLYLRNFFVSICQLFRVDLILPTKYIFLSSENIDRWDRVGRYTSRWRCQFQKYLGLGFVREGKVSAHWWPDSDPPQWPHTTYLSEGIRDTLRRPHNQKIYEKFQKNRWKIQNLYVKINIIAQKLFFTKSSIQQQKIYFLLICPKLC